MSLYDSVRLDLARYNPDWYEAMHVSDLACWLSNWRSAELLDLYAESLAEKKLCRTPIELAVAARLARASYVALSPEAIRAVATDPHFKVLSEIALVERREYRRALNQGRAALFATLRSLLPDRYNNPGG